MTLTEYNREAKRKWRAENGHEGMAEYWLRGGRAKKLAYWAANKDEINRRRRERRSIKRGAK